MYPDVHYLLYSLAVIYYLLYSLAVIYYLLYSLAVIYWIPVQEFDVIDGDLVWSSPLQVEVLGHLRGGITRVPMSHCPSLEGSASLPCMCGCTFHCPHPPINQIY